MSRSPTWSRSRLWLLPTVLIAAALCVPAQVLAGPLAGAIFTTLPDGARVNANIYDDRDDVYLDGGPPLNAPAGAAGLPAGDYYFQVTDPSGKVLLSEDPVECRRFTVSADGVIVAVVPASQSVKVKGQMVDEDCAHLTGIDVDHSELGAITVQLMPYSKTPNPGGVYKVWVTPVEHFVGDPTQIDNPDFFHGFHPAWSKTDNYKVRQKRPFVSPELNIVKFHDADLDCTKDADESEVAGWPVLVTDPLGVETLHHTPVNMIAEPAGTYTITEVVLDGSMPTSATVDGQSFACYPSADGTASVVVSGDDEETHEILFGNLGLGEISACKFYDRNLDGVKNMEPGIAGWQFQLTGVAFNGDLVGPITATSGDDGCATFADLMPGNYVVEELIPAGSTWYASTGTTSATISLQSNLTLANGVLGLNGASVEFGNYCTDVVDFNTKGYWHNKNGIGELQSDPARFAQILAFVHSLDPYDDPSGYFGAGDEPFDGMYADGTSVPAGKGVLENDDIADAGTTEAEISNFLIGSVGDGGSREQLAEQLLAFIFNSYTRLDNPGAVLPLPDGTALSAGAMIQAAADAWTAGDHSAVQHWIGVLDGLNNSDAIDVVRFFPCAIDYAD